MPFTNLPIVNSVISGYVKKMIHCNYSWTSINYMYMQGECNYALTHCWRGVLTAAPSFDSSLSLGAIKKSSFIGGVYSKTAGKFGLKILQDN
jgi:hypothetical protein